MRRSVSQNCMALIILRASQGSIIAVIKTEYCVLILEKSCNKKHLLIPIRNQIPGLSNLLPSLADLWGVGLALEAYSLNRYS